VAAIPVGGVRCDPCGVMRCIAPQGSECTPPTCIAAKTPELIVGIINSVF